MQLAGSALARSEAMVELAVFSIRAAPGIFP